MVEGTKSDVFFTELRSYVKKRKRYFQAAWLLWPSVKDTELTFFFVVVVL